MTSELKNLPTSPINGIGKVKLFDTISTRLIIDFYKQQENLDVAEYFASLDEIFILECEDTGYRFYYPFEVIGDAAFYKGLRNSEYDRDEADDHKFAYQHIEKEIKVLEIGCGSGKFLSRILPITKDVSGLELNEIGAKSAVEKGLKVRVQFIEEHATENPECYDVVCAFQVLEHIAEVKSFLEASLKTLKKGGKLIFSVPNNEPFFQKHNKYEVLNLPPHHMGLWNLDAFKALQRYFNLELIDSEFTGKTSFKGNVFLRAKRMAKIQTLPNFLSTAEMAKILAFSPISAVMGGIDLIAGNQVFSYLSVVFIKK
jgi:2-polyprenyl-3-methyl-5-hydroxy-6-metoxy-1,4-benzoquinol methylase